MSNIGILGGTFDPIHEGHIMLAKEAYYQYKLDKIWIMLSKNPPHKSGKKVSDASIREEMVKLAIKDYSYMEYSDFELKRDGYIYTADTLTLLEQEYPNDKFFFIIGGDSLRDFDTWYHPEIILQKCVLLAAMRDDIVNASFDNSISKLKADFSAYKPDIRVLYTKPINIASHTIRANVSKIEQYKPFINNDVLNYIKNHHLYE